jgi:agmatinase
MRTREEILQGFDPSGPGRENHLFGSPFTAEEAAVTVIPAPWEVTRPSNHGCATAPEMILAASRDIKRAVDGIPKPWELGISILPIPLDVIDQNRVLCARVLEHTSRLNTGSAFDENDALLDEINAGCEQFNNQLKNVCRQQLVKGKLIGVLGGDHSISLGTIRALSEHYGRFGVLQIDSRPDLCRRYQGLAYSHRSIMFNIMKIPAVGKLVQVGIRDWTPEEHEALEIGKGRIRTYFDQQLKPDGGRKWNATCQDIVKQLPPLVYLSVDHSGLGTALTPDQLSGGMSEEQLNVLIKCVAQSGCKIIGFDLSEIAVDIGDNTTVGARILYQLCCWMAVSQHLLAADR